MLSGKRVHALGEKVTCFPGRVSNRKIYSEIAREFGVFKI